MLSIAPAILFFWAFFVAAIACGAFFLFLLDVLFPAIGVQEAAEPLFDFSAVRSSAARVSASQYTDPGVARLAAILSNPEHRADRVCLFPPLSYPVKAQAAQPALSTYDDDDSMLLFMIRDMSSFFIVPFIGYAILQFLFPLYPSL